MGPAVHRGDPDARRKWLADRHEAGRSDLDIRRSSRPPSVHAAEFSKTVALLRRGVSSDSTRPDETLPRRDKRTVEYSAGGTTPIGLPGLLPDDPPRPRRLPLRPVARRRAPARGLRLAREHRGDVVEPETQR